MKKVIFAATLGLAAFITTVIFYNTQQADINYYQGRGLFEKGRYDEAAEFYKKALLISPARSDALTDLARCYQWTKRYEKAIEIFQKILLQKPQDNDLKISLAETYSWMKNYENAISLYEEVIRATGAIDAEKRLAEVYIWNKQPGKAEGVLRGVLKDKPWDFKAKLLLAEAMLRSGKEEEAVKIFEKLASEKKLGKIREIDKNEIDKLLGEAYIANEDYERAIIHYKKVLKIEPSNVKARIAAADILSWQKKYDESIIEYGKALAADPRNLKIKEKLAAVYTWNKDYEKAENLYKEIIQKDPDDLDVYISLGRILIWGKRYKEALRYFDAALSQKKGRDLKILYGQALLFSGDRKSAQEVFEGVVKENSDDLEAKVCLADVFAYNKEFDKAIRLYKEVLRRGFDLEVKRKLADVLSWDRKYAEAVKLCDEILEDREDPEIRLQKARILGWNRKYDKSEKEYQKILDIKGDKNVELEMKAKLFYWDGRVERAIRYYNELIGADPENLEAMFDLSQVYAYQSMWNDAIQAYRKIIDVSPVYFRANEGLEKAMLISEHCSLNSGYEFFEAASAGRDQDIKRHSSFNKFNYPLNYNLNLNAVYKFTYRSFDDFDDLLENEGKIKISYINNPGWSLSGFYDFIAYNECINTIHTFGANYNFRIFDCGTFDFSYQRERLENNSKVIRDGLYSDNYKERMDLDINKRLKLAADYLFAGYSDDNYKHEPGFDLLYYILLDPKRLSVKYRYFYRNFDKKANDYFSPKGFSVNSLALNWRHFLNKEEIFFGADDIYYDLGCEITADSKYVVGCKVSAELNWDINKSLNVNIKGALVNSSDDVYKDKAVIAAMKYYF